MGEREHKKEYSVSSKNYNQSISSPNLDVKNKFHINMESIDSVNLNNLRKKSLDRIQKETEIKPEETVPDISEIYGEKTSSKVTTVEKKESKTSSNGISNILKKLLPEELIALLTFILIIVFMIISVVVYNVMVNYL